MQCSWLFLFFTIISSSCRYGKDSRLTQSLNNSLAFFLFDLISILDRGYVFNLIRNYYKQMCAKIASLPDAVPLVHYKVTKCNKELLHIILLFLACWSKASFDFSVHALAVFCDSRNNTFILVYTFITPATKELLHY